MKEHFIHIPPYLDCTDPKRKGCVTFMGKQYRIDDDWNDDKLTEVIIDSGSGRKRVMVDWDKVTKNFAKKGPAKASPKLEINRKKSTDKETIT